MPIYDYRCPKGHITEHYVPIRTDTPTIQCPCGYVSARVFSPGAGRSLTFEEGKEQYIWNLEPIVQPGQHSRGPVRVASPSQHKAAMKRAGVRESVASDWDKLKLSDRAKNKRPKRWL